MYMDIYICTCLYRQESNCTLVVVSRWRHGSWRLHMTAGKDLTSHSDILQQRGITPAGSPASNQSPIQFRARAEDSCMCWLGTSASAPCTIVHLLQQASKRKTCMIYVTTQATCPIYTAMQAHHAYTRISSMERFSSY
jgi:hypothetical protein